MTANDPRDGAEKNGPPNGKPEPAAGGLSASSPDAANPPGAGEFPCKNCGGPLMFAPGTVQIKCPYCGAANDIPLAAADGGGFLRENDYLQGLEAERARRAEETGEPAEAARCSGCGAETTVSPNRTSDTCPYCGTPFVMQNNSSRKLDVQAVLPFAIDSGKAAAIYRGWVASRWFAPGDFKRRATRAEAMRGVYMPYWTYDAVARTWYTGQRGDAYYAARQVMTDRNGGTEPETRQVRQIRWSPASGSVAISFDDVLVPASRSLPGGLVDGLEPWNLGNLKPFRREFLSGFVTEAHQLTLEEGFADAKRRMEPTIDSAIRRDIGGDEQRVVSKKSRYDKITFKHILLPVWISAYAYNGGTYRFIVNAQTGEAAGDRPWSAWKIAAAVIAGLAAAGALVSSLQDSGLL